MNTKRMLVEYVDEIVYSFDITDCDTLIEVSQLVNKMIEDYGPNTRILFDSGHESIHETLLVVKTREESDGEYQARLKREKRLRDRELAELARLKAKYGDNDGI